MNLRRKISVIALLFSLGLDAQVLTLDSILLIIEKQQPDLQVYNAKINALNAYAEGARALDAPQVGGGFFMTPYNPMLWKADPSMYSNGMGSFMISAQQMITNPRKLSANEDYMKSMSGMETEMKNTMRNDIFSMAKMSYYECVLLKRKLSILQQSDELLAYLIKSTELRYTYGMDKMNAYYKAKGMQGDIENMKLMMEQEIQQKRIELNTLMDRDKNFLFEVDTTLIIKSYENTVADSSLITASRSDFKAIVKNENVLRSKQSYEQSKGLPDFGVKYDHMIGFGSQPQLYSLMFMVSVPVAPWSSKMYQANVSGLNYEIESLKNQQESFVNTVSGNLENLKVKIGSKKQQLALFEKIILPSMKKNYETTLLAYEQNTEELFMVLDAWQSLKLMQLNYVDQLQELILLQVEYEKQLEIK